MAQRLAEARMNENDFPFDDVVTISAPRNQEVPLVEGLCIER